MTNCIKDLIFENINDKYAWGNYGEFKVLMMRENGFINVTKLCMEGEKRFLKWNENKSSELFINEVSSSTRIRVDDILITITGGNQPLIRGTYAHPDLVPHIASWVSPSFAIKVSRIVNEYLVREEKDRCARLEAQKNVLEGEKSDLIKRLDKMDEERRISELKAEEERRKAEERYQEMCKRYGFQEDKLDFTNKTLVETKHELVNVKEILEATEEKMEVATELMEVANEKLECVEEKLECVEEKLECVEERLEHVEEKLGIAKEIVVPKEQNIEYHEMFTLLKRRQFNPETEWEYYAICGQTKYVKTTRTRKMRTDGMVEALSFEYTPNTKNILHRVKEQLSESIDYRGNNIDRKPGVSERGLLRLIRDIEKERVEMMD